MAELKFVNYISIDGSPEVLMDYLSDQQKACCSKKIAEKLGRIVSEYYSNHMEEFRCLKKD